MGWLSLLRFAPSLAKWGAAAFGLYKVNEHANKEGKSLGSATADFVGDFAETSGEIAAKGVKAALKGAGKGIGSAKDGPAYEGDTDYAEGDAEATNPVDRLFGSMFGSGGVGDMVGGFFGNLADGKTSGMGLAALLGGLFMAFTGRGFMSKIIGGVLALVGLSMNSGRGRQPQLAQAQPTQGRRDWGGVVETAKATGEAVAEATANDAQDVREDRGGEEEETDRTIRR